jgi:squalene synthase HpnC
MPVDHYENFPVASVLLPRRLVPAVEAIYAFARSADDLADEGDATPAERLAALAAYGAALDAIQRGAIQRGAIQRGAIQRGAIQRGAIGRDAAPADPLFARLAAVIAQYRLPLQPFHDLLSAFRQDIVTKSYADYALLLDYCRRSANPVGRLMLALYNADDQPNVAQSDAICSALQLINFWQDVGVDRQKDRIYLPREDLARFGVDPAQLDRAEVDERWRALMGFEVARARALLLHGAPLALRLPGRIGWELRLVVQGGLRILEAIERVDYDVFRRRPQLRRRDWLVIGWRAVCM